MDAVQSKIANLGGTIELWSRPNKGTRFTIKLPLTLSIIQALMVRVGTETFAIPLDLVERVVIIKEEEVIQTVSQEVYRFQEDLIPIIRTDQLLGIEGNTVGKKFAIIVNSEQQYYGLLADELVGQQEIVIKRSIRSSSSWIAIRGDDFRKRLDCTDFRCQCDLWRKKDERQ